MATETEEGKQIRELGEGLHKSIKALEEKVKDGTDAKDKVKELDDQLGKLKELGDKFPKLADQVEEIVLQLNTPDFGKTKSISLEKDFEEGLKKSLEGKDFKNRSDTASFKWDQGQKGISKAAGIITSANFTSDGVTPVAVNPDYSMTVVTNPVRKVHMRSIITQTPMSGDVFRYPQHTGHGEGDFEVQANHGDLKSQIEEEYRMVNLVAHTVAGYYRVAKQNLADTPWLMQSLLSEGTERYLKAEDRKFLYGVGGDDDIKGLESYATAYTGSMPNVYEALLNPIFELMDDDQDPSSILVRPSNYAQLLKYKTTTGEYNFPMLFVGNQQQPMNIAGVPIWMSTAVKANQAFVGDLSAQNVQIRVREGMGVEFSYEDQDNFVRNLVTIRIESRVNLQVNRTDAVKKIDLSLIAPIV